MIKGVLLDLGGVVYLGDQALPGAIESIERLKSEGLAIRFITNVMRQSRRGLIGKLAGTSSSMSAFVAATSDVEGTADGTLTDIKGDASIRRLSPN